VVEHLLSKCKAQYHQENKVQRNSTFYKAEKHSSTDQQSSPFLPSSSVGLLGTIKGVDRKTSGEGATRSDEFLYIKRESQVFLP
jgi:hypothetical protein